MVEFWYLRDTCKWNTEKPYILESNASYDTEVISNVEKDKFPVLLTDVRGNEQNFTYDDHGFRFLTKATAVDLNSDQEQDTRAYINETICLLKDEFEAERVICYDVRRRSSNELRSEVKAVVENVYDEPRLPAPPVYAVHIDHTVNGGYHRARRHLTDEEIERYIDSGDWRIRIVNTWRPLKHIEASPLALCDFKSLSVDDLVETDLVSEDYVGETYSVKYNTSHRFYWMGNQSPEEVCIFVVFDSLNATSFNGVTTCAHTAFDNPLAKPNSGHRESIEVRSLVFTRR